MYAEAGEGQERLWYLCDNMYAEGEEVQSRARQGRLVAAALVMKDFSSLRAKEVGEVSLSAD